MLGARIVVARFGTVDEPARRFIQRLRGIGYAGWLVVTHSVVVEAAALTQVRDWISPKVAAPKKVEPKKVEPKKPVAKVTT